MHGEKSVIRHLFNTSVQRERAPNLDSQFSRGSKKEILRQMLLDTEFNEGPTSSFWHFGDSHLGIGFSFLSNILNIVSLSMVMSCTLSATCSSQVFSFLLY